MPVTLTLSTRAAVIAALPTAPDDATDRADRERARVAAELERQAQRLAAAEHAADEARAALDLAAQALGLSPGAKHEDVIARMHELVRPVPAAPATPEPPWSKECEWRALKDGDLALDRAHFRYLREVHTRQKEEDGPPPTDDDRRILVLRVGDRVAWLRGDGVWNNSTAHIDAPAFVGGRKPAGTNSPRALVIAQGLKGDAAGVQEAWHRWLRAAEICPGLDAALAEEQPAAPAAPVPAPTSTARMGGGL